MSDDAKEFLLLNNDYQLEIMRKVDAKNRFLEKMGFRESADENNRHLTVKPQALDKVSHNYINILDSLYAKGV